MGYQVNNKRIAKNTLLLYFRMVFLMLISLYTSRVVLNALGVVDYGLYNVVGGVVTLFSLISGSLSTSISRFLAYSLGRNETDRLTSIFSTSLNIQIILSLVIILLAETIGLWFLNTKMTIPVERLTAANWVFHFSILTFVINLISIPYNAVIISHEKMSAFAYISIVEATGKLLISYLIVINPFDRLVYYALLIAILSIIIRFIYSIYCKKHFSEARYKFLIDKSLLREMFGFASWNFLGSSAKILREHGGNILINLFFDPSVNAARGIATKVNSTLQGFVSNFMMALNPQITKSCAIQDYKNMFTLVFRGALFSFYLLFTISLPILLNTHYILVTWLKLVPEYCVIFVQLILILAMVDVLSGTLITSILATGRVKQYQIAVGTLVLMNIPIGYVVLKMGFPPQSIFIISIFISFLALFLRLFMLSNIIPISRWQYIQQVVLRALTVSALSFIIPYYCSRSVNESFVAFVIVTFVSVLSTLTVIYFFGLSDKEKHYIINFVKSKIKKSRKQ